MKAILTYHSIDSSGSPVSISERAFREHVQWLNRARVEAVSLEELHELPAHADAVAVTFDDGYVSFGRFAWPLLRKHEIPVTLFVVTDLAGGRNRWGPKGGPIPELRLHGWDELRRLADEGVDLGSHTRSHPDLTDEDRDRIGEEIEGSAERLRRELGLRPRTFAYPYGRHDSTVVSVAREHYRLACTTELRALGVSEDPHLLPRIDARYLRRPGQIARWGSQRFRARLGLRRLGRRLRRALGRGAAP